MAPGKKEILKSVSGQFLSGHLTAILGSSGAGKTSLLSVLAGHTRKGVDGTILINGIPQRMETFRKTSCYLMQEDLVRPLLTVKEAINAAAKLKMGMNFSSEDKKAAVKDVITLTGLEECSDTITKNLSGGERKRLSIALEIVNKPQVVFLDEPTTGLDDVMALKLVRLLKSAASKGSTIVCTIHQPSDLIFQLFDQVYFMSDGNCIYNGQVNSIVAFLSGINLHCPSTHSPCDYIIELVHFHEQNTCTLGNAIENGRKCIKEGRSVNATVNQEKQKKPHLGEECPTDIPTPFWGEFSLLTCRMLTELKRSRTPIAMQIVTQILVGLCMGSIFKDVGRNGDRLLQNMFMYFGTVVFHNYTHMMPQALLFPQEMKLFRREYINGWYGLKAYYMAICLTTSPLTIISTLLFSMILYILTDQPMEMYRLFGFLLISVLLALISQACGQAIGSVCNTVVGCMVASFLLSPMIIMAIYGMGYGSLISLHMKLMMSLSYIRHSFVGYAVIMLRDRELLKCDQIYCYTSDPQIVLRMFGMEDNKYYLVVLYLMIFLFIFKCCTYFLIRFSVTRNTDLPAAKYL